MSAFDFTALTDQELQTWIDQTFADTKKASEEQPESEWHQSCFAALMMGIFEAQRRGYQPTRH